MPLDIDKEMAALERMTAGQLAERFAELFGEQTHSRHRTYLIRKILWKLQARDAGGLSARALKRATELAKDVELRVMPPATLEPRPVAEVVTTAPVTRDSRLPLPGASRKVYVHPAHHAGYYPGAEGMSLKVIFDPQTGKLLGAQGVGGAGVDKRIDVLAVAIQAGMTVFDLEEMELCYAPQFGSAKDSVNMAGFVAAGLLRGDHPQTDWEAVEAMADKPFLLDVRTPQEYTAGHIDGAVNVPVDELRSRLSEVPQGRPIVAYCQVGQRGYLATRILMQAGFTVSNLGGGYKTYLLHCPGTGR